MNRQNPNVPDLYQGPIRALNKLRPSAGLTAVDQAVAISEGLKSWDFHAHGDWRDALAVAARRQELRIRNSYALLAQYLLKIDHRRAAEIGKLVEKTADRHPVTITSIVRNAGGVKKATASSFEPPPPLKIRVRRQRSQSR